MRHELRVVGPNCLGLLANQPDVRLDATFGGELPAPGGLAVASQSGGVGIVLLETARRIGLGVRHFVSLGNKADVSSNDLLAAWLDDDDVTAAAFYLELFGNSAKFARIARRFSERKPLLEQCFLVDLHVHGNCQSPETNMIASAAAPPPSATLAGRRSEPSRSRRT